MIHKGVRGGWIHGLEVTKGGSWVSHIQYADDTIHPCDARENLKVNFFKSTLVGIIVPFEEDILEGVEKLKEAIQLVPGNGVALDEDDLICDSFTCEVNSIVWMPWLRRDLSDEETDELVFLLERLRLVSPNLEKEDSMSWKVSPRNGFSLGSRK
ncbi:hypothetical protein QJS10_CPA03g01349 [Acorus calamus]|uniref:Uncharacterized protein n=1 Tax=Acorus calamus TaxID=4465 RepID=A0AAV9F7R1_ACOCL|nr:hypothetical protein QJS10_CPA03g01349 [Acorus calamus]